jgi:deazaflavin-dependent oxidoreductase (nitroreductase family)
MRIQHNGTYAVFASNAGASKHPFWYHNLVAHPLVELQDGSLKTDMRAREVFGEEKNAWWRRAEAALSGFPDYRASAGLTVAPAISPRTSISSGRARWSARLVPPAPTRRLSTRWKH